MAWPRGPARETAAEVSESDFSDTAAFLTRYWQLPIRADPAGRLNLAPESCGECHTAQYNQWSKSVHAHAMGPGVVGQLMGFSPKDAAACRLCHAPLDRQQSHTFDVKPPAPGRSPDQIWPVEEVQTQIYDSDTELPNPAYDTSLAKKAIVCAACHVRNGVVYGPPPLPDPAKPRQKSPHPIRYTSYFESAEFCRACHQFSPDNAINGKPLENTYEEWRHSSWGKQGVSCQKCHMPGRGHTWKGVHSSDQVRLALTIDFETNEQKDAISGRLRIVNSNAGHFFPTYVTPRIVASVELIDAQGRAVHGDRIEGVISREIILTSNERREIRDSRIAPGDTFSLPYRFAWSKLPDADLRRLDAVRVDVTVFPDHFYTGLFEALLDDELGSEALRMIRQAHRNSIESAYSAYSETRPARFGGPRAGD
ncbi:hypothetical protein HY522_03285 [bacterium]|nr:hypothetical protein [bacterium]